MDNESKKLEIPEFLKQTKKVEVESQNDKFYNFNLLGSEEEEFINSKGELQIPKFTREIQNKENIIDFQTYQKLNRIKADEEISQKEFFEIKISKTKFKIILAALLASIALTLGAAKSINKIIEEEKFIETTIENDEFLNSIIIYTNDVSPEPELRISNPIRKTQEIISNEKVAEYINDMENITEEQKEDIMNHFGVKLPEKNSARSHQ